MFDLWMRVLVACWNLFASDAPARELLAEDCASCHPRHVAEWTASRHAVAFTNGLFRYEFDSRRTAWCASCHAPSAADPRTVRDEDPLAVQGIGCMTCHLGREGKLLARSKAPHSPHQTLISEEFGNADFCGGCHEFSFPVMGDDGMPTGFRDLAMQSTVSEFAATAAAERGEDCRSCHMREGTGHGFLGSHHEATLRSALELSVCFDGSAIQTTIQNVGAAHSVPTGGVNRHMVLRVWRSEAPGEMVEHFIGRRFAGDTEGEKELVTSTELRAGEGRRFAAPLQAMGATRDAAVNIELRYIYPLEEFAELAPGTRRFATVARHRTTANALARCSSP